MFTKEQNDVKNYIINPFSKMTNNHDNEYSKKLQFRQP